MKKKIFCLTITESRLYEYDDTKFKLFSTYENALSGRRIAVDEYKKQHPQCDWEYEDDGIIYLQDHTDMLVTFKIEEVEID